MDAAALELAVTIASKSPIAVQTSKVALVYSRDHGVEEGLDYMVRRRRVGRKEKEEEDR